MKIKLVIFPFEERYDKERYDEERGTTMKTQKKPKSYEAHSADLRKGILLLSVLSQLHQPQYGYDLAMIMEAKGIKADTNTLYPLLRRLEAQKWIRALWKTGKGKARKYYLRTPAGDELYQALKTDWLKLNAALIAMLNEGPEEAEQAALKAGSAAEKDRGNETKQVASQEEKSSPEKMPLTKEQHDKKERTKNENELKEKTTELKAETKKSKEGPEELKEEPEKESKEQLKVQKSQSKGQKEQPEEQKEQATEPELELKNSNEKEKEEKENKDEKKKKKKKKKK